MYYYPEHFQIQEIFPPEIVAANIYNTGQFIENQIWRLMDWRILWTADRLQERFGTMVVNDYLWNGNNKYRGFRPFVALFDEGHYKITAEIRAEWSSFTSQHCFGRALDSKFKYISAEDIRRDIKRNQNDSIYQYIKAIEDGIDWLHFDVRSWNVNTNDILFFNN